MRKKSIWKRLITFQGSINSTLVGVMVLILFYFLLIALVMGFSRVLLINANANPSVNLLIIIIIILLIIFLIVPIIFVIVKLIKERAHALPGARLKTRFVLLFAFITLITIIPQAVISIIFINISIHFWLSENIVETLDGGVQVAIKFYTDKVDNLQKFSKSPLLPYLFRDIDTKPERMYNEITSVNPEISFIQVFNADGRELFFAGNTAAQLERIKINEFPSYSTVRDLRIIRSNITLQIRGKPYYILFGIVFANQFSEYGEKLTSSMRKFRQLENYKSLFGFSVIVFYIIFTFPIFLLSLLISFLLTGEIIRPIVHLDEATRRVAEGDFSFRILTRANDEMTLLVNSFNKMVSELAASRKKLIHAEKIAAWQEIARRLAHEIKNPLTPIKLSAQRLLKKFHENTPNFDTILESSISAIIDEVENLTSMLNEFSSFAKLPRPNPEYINLITIIEEAASMYKSLSQSISIQSGRLDPEVMINADKNQMKQAFGNLFKNAIEAMPNGGEITVSGDLVKKFNIVYYRIQLKDTGLGIAEELQENVFNPYFTTKKEGTGLGLAIVESIIFVHNGNIWFESKLGMGTTFYIDLPIGTKNG